MNREQLYKIRDLLSTGEIFTKSETDYRITDAGVIKLIAEIERIKANPLDGLVMQKIMGIINEAIETERHLILEILPSGLTQRYEHRYATKVLTKLKKKIENNFSA